MTNHYIVQIIKKGTHDVTWLTKYKFQLSIQITRVVFGFRSENKNIFFLKSYFFLIDNLYNNTYI